MRYNFKDEDLVMICSQRSVTISMALWNAHNIPGYAYGSQNRYIWHQEVRYKILVSSSKLVRALC
jgi:hypothetical protein